MQPPFRLAAVLRLRETERDARRQDWIAACETEAAVKIRAEQLCEEIRGEQARRRAAFSGGSVPLEEIQLHHRYELALRDELKSIQQAHHEAARARESCESLLFVAEQALETIQRLRERHEQQQSLELQRRDQRACDEAAARTMPGHRLSQLG